MLKILLFLFLLFCVIALIMIIIEGVGVLDVTSGVYTQEDKDIGRIPTNDDGDPIYDVGDNIPYNAYHPDYPPFKRDENQRNLWFQATVVIILTAIFFAIVMMTIPIAPPHHGVLHVPADHAIHHPIHHPIHHQIHRPTHHLEWNPGDPPMHPTMGNNF